MHFASDSELANKLAEARIQAERCRDGRLTPTISVAESLAWEFGFITAEEALRRVQSPKCDHAAVA